MSEGRKIMQVRSARQVPVRVQLLDDEILDVTVDKRAVGWILFDQVCEHLNVLEKDYFGLNYINPEGMKYWLDNEKKITKQMKGLQAWNLCFEVKFYPSDPLQMVEDLTRYQLCLQIRRDIVNERVPCSTVTYALLGSFTAQSELGDFEVEEFGTGTSYLKDIQFAPHQDRELLAQIGKLHRSHKGLTPEDSELKFLENAKKLALYGVELHPAKDAEGKDIQLGVCASGIIVYKDKQQVNRFVWPKILKMSYRRNKFYIKIRPGEFENFASLIGFRTAGVKMAKRLWKICVEHHSFFRFKEPEPMKSLSVIPRFGSRFRYSGRTQWQSRQVVSEEARDSPYFDRVLSKRGTFGGRTQNMKQRDEDRRRQRDEMRRGPPPPAPAPFTQEPKVQIHEKEREQNGTPPEPKRTPPEPRHAPPVAPKPKPVIAPKPKPSPRVGRAGDDTASYDKGSRGSLNDSFEEIPDRKSKMERMHAVMTPLAAVMQKSLDKNKNVEEEEDDRYSDHSDRRDDDRRSVDRYEDEMDARPITPEVIDQEITPEPIQQAPMSAKERKQYEKEQKEKAKREKEEEKMRKKEEEKEKKRLEKERKALEAAEKKAAKQKSKQKSAPLTKKEIERRDSKSSTDMGRDWDEARAQEHPGSVTPERTIKRFSSFEERKGKGVDVDNDDDDDDRPPTPPEPLEGSLKGRQRGRRNQKKEDEGSASDYVTDEENRKEPPRRRDRGRSYDDEEEEVSF